MKANLKFIFTIGCILPITAIGQNRQQTEVRTVPFKEWSSKFESLDNKGKCWNILYMAEMKTSNGRSTENDVVINFVTDYPEPLKKAEWFKWSPLDKCWVKAAKPRVVSEAESFKYLLEINKPGTYALMQPQKTNSKGLALMAPKGYVFDKVIVSQENPGLYLNLSPLKATRKLVVPITDIQFDTRMNIFLKNKKGENYIVTRNYAGNFTEFDTRLNPTEYRVLKVGSEFITPYEEDVVILSN